MTGHRGSEEELAAVEQALLLCALDEALRLGEGEEGALQAFLACGAELASMLVEAAQRAGESPAAWVARYWPY